uniref:Uncharacterized protein n=1 Tax=Timema douglasi TaxID=61478 RepID=A0A7R8VQQ0_TIMDO|nr:unnamed protein product [Timema douglasi]
MMFSSGDLSSEFDDVPDDSSTTSSTHESQKSASTYAPSSSSAAPATQPHPVQSQGSGDLSLNLRPGSKTTSAPSSPAKTRESLLQRVQSLTGVARDQGASILEASGSFHEQ